MPSNVTRWFFNNISNPTSLDGDTGSGWSWVAAVHPCYPAPVATAACSAAPSYRNRQPGIPGGPAPLNLQTQGQRSSEIGHWNWVKVYTAESIYVHHHRIKEQGLSSSIGKKSRRKFTIQRQDIKKQRLLHSVLSNIHYILLLHGNRICVIQCVSHQRLGIPVSLYTTYFLELNQILVNIIWPYIKGFKSYTKKLNIKFNIIF